MISQAHCVNSGERLVISQAHTVSRNTRPGLYPLTVRIPQSESHSPNLATLTIHILSGIYSPLSDIYPPLPRCYGLPALANLLLFANLLLDTDSWATTLPASSSSSLFSLRSPLVFSALSDVSALASQLPWTRSAAQPTQPTPTSRHRPAATVHSGLHRPASTVSAATTPPLWLRTAAISQPPPTSLDA